VPFAVGLKPSAIRDKARLRGLTHAVGLKPSASQDEARLRGLTHAVGLMEPVFALCRRAEALGYTGQSPPARAIPDLILKDHKPSGRRGEARLRGTRTPTVTLSVISYRLSAIGYRLSAISYRLSAIGYRLSAIGYRLSAIGYRLSAIGYRLSAIGYRLSKAQPACTG
jgi:hypothetical protein